MINRGCGAFAQAGRTDALGGVAAAAFAIVLLLPAHAIAQESSVPTVKEPSSSDAEAAASERDEIVVTGTSIRGIQAAGSQTVNLDREGIQATGLTSVADVAKTIPQLQGLGVNEIGNPNGSNAQRGTALNLRGLGAQATLLLVNGRRLAPTGTYTTFTEANVVPVAALERIEVVADGASAIYGSDAVAGVVNYVLRSNFDGIELTPRYTHDRYYDEYGASLVVGKTWSDLGGLGAGNIMLSYDYNARSAFVQGDNPRLRQDLRQYGGLDNRQVGNAISVNDQATIVTSTGTYTVPAGSNGVGLTGANLIVNNPGLIDLSDYNDYLPRIRRHQVVGTFNQELGDRVELKFQGFFSERQIYNRSLVIATGNDAYTVTSASPFYITGVPGVAPGAPLRVSYNTFKDIGYRETNSFDQSLLLNPSLHIKLFGDWEADLSYSYGRNRTCGNCTENFVNQAAANGAILRGQFNPFDTRPASPAQQAAIVGDNDLNSWNRIHNVVAKVDGTLFTLGDADFKAALGGEYYFNQNRFRAGANGGANNTYSVADDITQKRNVKALFAEVNAPLVTESMNIPLVRSFTVSAAIRTEEYSDFGRTTNPKIGVIWNVADGIKLRGSWGTSFRAPAFPDLQGALFRSSLDVVNNSGRSDILIDNPALKLSKIVSFGGINKDLNPETAETYSLGADFAPTGLPGFTTSLTYYNVNYSGRIAAPAGGGFAAPSVVLSTPQNAALYAPFTYATPTPAGCVPGNVSTYNATLQEFLKIPVSAFVPPIADGCAIRAIIDTRLQNIAATMQDGIDVTTNYRWSDNAGDWGIGGSMTYILHSKNKALAGLPAQDQVSQINNPVRVRARANASWTDQVFGVNLFVNYVGSYLNNATITIGGVRQPDVKIPAWATVDLGLNYTVKDEGGMFGGLRASVNVQNLLNSEPPIVISSANTSVDFQNANAFGRMITFQISKSF